MSTLSQFGFGGGIKSIQRGLISMTATSTATATISPVNTSKSILYFLGNSTAPNSGDISSNSINRMAYLTLTDSTTITASGAPTSTSSGMAVSWQLVEYY
jgi:hypothetical protein